MRARLNGQVEVAKDANSRTSRVAEVNILELNPAFDLFELLALCRLCINFRDTIKQPEDIVRGRGRFTDIGDEGEDVSGLYTAKGDALGCEKKTKKRQCLYTV